MGSKSKKPSKGPITVAKRGENKEEPREKANETPQKTSAKEHKDSESPARTPSGRSNKPQPRSRQTSGVNPRKVSEGLKQLPQNAFRFVRESYLMLDSDGSGSVSKETMRDMLASLGMRDSNDKKLNSMLERAGDPITFAGYLAVMSEFLAELPSREELDIMLEAFQGKDGSFDQTEMQRALLTQGLTQDEIDSVMHRFSKPSRYGETFDPKAFANAMSI